jgi:hypothetical protein
MTLKQAYLQHGDGSLRPEYTPRLRLKPKAPETGYVDGAWWPWSDDLTIELPDLLAVLSVRLGAIERVLYNLNEWITPPRKFAVGSRSARLDGYRYQPIHTITVLGTAQHAITLLVVPHHTDPDHAHAAMMNAACPNNTATIDHLLMVNLAKSIDCSETTGS